MTRSREKRYEIRLTEEEFEKVEKLRAKSKLTKQDYGLKSLMDKDIVVVDGILDLADQVRRVGVNINQITHIVNMSKAISKDEISKLDNELKEIWNLLYKFLKSNGR